MLTPLLTEVIAFLARLHRCSLSGNRFSGAAAASLCAHFRCYPGRLQQLDGIDLGVHDAALPPALKHSDNRMVLDYYRNLLCGYIVYRRCRLMLLGGGGVGKTTLVNRLVSGEFTRVAITHGISQRTCTTSGHWAVLVLSCASGCVYGLVCSIVWRAMGNHSTELCRCRRCSSTC